MLGGIIGRIQAFRKRLQEGHQSRRIVLVIVFVALFVDNMLLTTVVPIIPNFLYKLQHPNASRDLDQLSEYCANYNPKEVPQPEINFPITKRPRVTPAPSPTPPVNCAELEQLLNETSKEERHKDILKENVAVGIMFASKAIVQLITNPFVGPVTNKIGYSIPLFTGFIIMFISTIIFAFAENYAVLFLARSVQGIGSACSSVSGLGMLANVYTDDEERGNAMGIALGGVALGVLVGPPYGGVMYQFVGKESAFLLLACLALLDGCLQLMALRIGVHPEEKKGTSLKSLLKDPYILIAAGSITFANMGIAMLEPTLPLWMLENMNSPKWQQGAVFLPASIAYLIGTNIFGPLAYKMGRWFSAMLGMCIVGSCLVAIPFAKNFNDLLAPNAGWGFAIGMVDSAMFPVMGNLVDLRHVAVYGSIYAIADVAMCLGFAIGPAISGGIIMAIGFRWMMWIMGIVNFAYAPLLLFLRNVPGRGEDQALTMANSSPTRITTYNSSKYEQFGNSMEEEIAESKPIRPVDDTQYGYDIDPTNRDK